MPKSERIYTPITAEQLKVIQELMKQEKRSKAYICAMLLTDAINSLVK